MLPWSGTGGTEACTAQEVGGVLQQADKEREILLPAEVAKLFRVDPKTVTRWAEQGRIPHFKTMGGHRRFYGDEVRPLAASILQ